MSGSSSNSLTLRVQCAEGTWRVSVGAGDPTARLYERVRDELRLASFAFALYRDRGRRDEVTSSKSRTLADFGLKHGEMLYLHPVNGACLFEQPAEAANITEMNPTPSTSKAGPSTSKTDLPLSQPQTSTVKEDDVDLELYQLNGSIQRQRDEKLCRHNSNGCCVHCSPLEPWDENYLKEHNIKHMSFHSYLRKIQAGKFVSLEEKTCKLKPGCREHPPWPRGVCSACQPAPVTLLRQTYRHVDNALLESPAMAERLITYWRATEHQRLGFLLGRYERHPDVPLGIRARICAIYEPAQTSSRDHISLQTDTKLAALEELQKELGLTRVGWIFTDLLVDDPRTGTVKHTRGVDSHFLSAQECITAATWQTEHPNHSRHSPTGRFGSKFITICVTGDKSGQVSLEGYQVSNQGAWLARDAVLLPARDAADLACVRKPGPSEYVADVYYKERDSYGNEVQVSASCVPVAYLLVDVPCGVAGAGGGGGAARPLFSPSARFPPAHRALQGHLQTLAALHQHLEDTPDFLEAMSDLHVLLYLLTNESYPIPLSELRPLLAAVRTGDEAAAGRWRADCAAWGSLVAAAAQDSEDSLAGAGGVGGGVWTCPHCTFHNRGGAVCDMCALPRDNAM